MSMDTEVLILGGGCAGLSLAAALAQHSPQMRVLTLEQRSTYTRDRTWCFWNTTDHPFRAGVTQEWHQWRVCASGKEVRQQSDRFCYQHLPADRFYEIAQHAIAGANQELCMRAQAGAIRPTVAGSEVDTNKGTIRARWVFDARTPVPGKVQPKLLQRFEGWHVRTAQPRFDPTCVDLMNFQPSSVDGRAVFFYVLPFSDREALVEITYLDAPDLVPECASERLHMRMAQLCPSGDFEVLYSESGSLPMGDWNRAQTGQTGAIPIGTRGGRVKPSSGYAFQRIQRQSQAFARALANGSDLPSRVESRCYDWLDDIFLRALQRKPQRTAEYFLQLFQSVSPEVLVPFLSETARPSQLLNTMWALPKRDFIQAASAHLLQGVA